MSESIDQHLPELTESQNTNTRSNVTGLQKMRRWLVAGIMAPILGYGASKGFEEMDKHGGPEVLMKQGLNQIDKAIGVKPSFPQVERGEGEQL